MTLNGLITAILDIIADPASNLTAAVMLMAAAVLIVLILVIVTMIAVLSSGSRTRHRRAKGASSSPSTDRGEATARPSRAPSRASRWILGHGGAWLIGATIAAVIFSGYVATSQDGYCLTCHSGQQQVPPPAGAHEETSCVRCHEDMWAAAANVVQRASDVGARYGFGSSQYSTTVRSSRCLACHRKDLKQVRQDEKTGVRISHAEPLEAGWACIDCHASDQHGDMASPVSMSSCLQCHDAQQASAECSTCHAKDTSAASGLAANRIYGVATITRTDCEGCHSMESCDACHKIRMPHSEEFLKTHPRYAGFDKKRLCYEQCHTEADCGKCHGAWSSHIPSFKEEHKRYPKDSACDSCHDRHEGPICDMCHDFNREPAN